MKATEARRAVDAARWAPSVHNTQPWWFRHRGARITLFADPERRLAAGDPDGREMLISCGAALFTLRLALAELGYEAKVHLLPDPGRVDVLADLDVRRGHIPSKDDLQLCRQIRRRRSHRGAFRAEPVRSALLSRLSEDARQEGAVLQLVTDRRARSALGSLTEAAEQLQRLDPAHAAEIARWAPGPESWRADGVQERAYPARDTRTDPYFPARDFPHGHAWGVETTSLEEDETSTGAVALLLTVDDSRRDWLRAGQALQRVLLRACAEEDASAALHTQALEVPELRDCVRLRFCDGAHPQVILRLGFTDVALSSVRRPVDEILEVEET